MGYVKAVVGTLGSAGACAFLWLMLASGGMNRTTQAIGVGLVVLHVLTFLLALMLAAQGRSRAAGNIAIAPIPALLGAMVILALAGH